MTLSTLPVEQLLKLRFPSYHKLLEHAKALTRSVADGSCDRAVELLEGLLRRYPHVLAIGQELVLALEECRRHDRAEQVLRQLEAEFLSLDEETLCRWGRLFKERGDAYARLPWSDPGGLPPDPDLAERSYRMALEKYDQAYRVRSGHYPGINTATLLLVLGALRPLAPGAAPGVEVVRSQERARELLAGRGTWKPELPDDLTVWHPATAGEAHLLLREWAEAADQYGKALRSRDLTPRARASIRRQIERILMGFRNLGVAIPPPFADPSALFAASPAPPADGSPPSPVDVTPPGPGLGPPL
jgi:hypothetical protein